MAWHTLVRLALPCPLLLTLACNDGQVQDSGDVDSSPTTSTSGETTVATTSATTLEASGSGSTTATATDASTAATEGTTAAAADSSTGPDEPVACTEDLTCNPGEICVRPCCGGPAPGCFELPRGGECGPDGTPDEGGVRCCQNDPDPQACMKLQWCSPVGCTADPPYCATLDQLDCNGTQCSAESCFNGSLNGSHLECSCK